MKKAKILICLLLVSFAIQAQNVTVAEPEFSDVTYLLTSDSTFVKLPRENGSLKTKAGASLYLTGIGKVKKRLTMEGTASTVVAPSNTVRLIIKANDNKTDAGSFINIFKFEVNNKERRALIAEAGTLSAAKSNSLGQIDYEAKKYGESSYYIVMSDLEPGEYGISLGDPNTLNEKNSLKITTFSVK